MEEIKDLEEHVENSPGFLDFYPKLACELAHMRFSTDGVPKREHLKKALGMIRERGLLCASPGTCSLCARWRFNGHQGGDDGRGEARHAGVEEAARGPHPSTPLRVDSPLRDEVQGQALHDGLPRQGLRVGSRPIRRSSSTTRTASSAAPAACSARSTTSPCDWPGGGMGVKYKYG